MRVGRDVSTYKCSEIGGKNDIYMSTHSTVSELNKYRCNI